MTILATAAAYVRDNAELLTRNGFTVAALIGKLDAIANGERYNPEICAAIEVGTAIYGKGSRMNGTRTRGRVTTIVVHDGQNPDGSRLEAVGLNLSAFIAYGLDPLPVR